MKTLMFRKEERLALGIKTDQGVIDVEAAAALFPEAGAPPVTFAQLMAQGEAGGAALSRLAAMAAEAAEELFQPEDSLTFGPCVPDCQKIICVGLNYVQHAIETKATELPKEPLLFGKFAHTLAGHREDIYMPGRTSRIDYEAELAIVIGRKAKNIGLDEALNYVYGFCNANDVSARDLQLKTSQWMLGKNCDGFCPVGPYLVSKDEVGDPNQLGIRCMVNGELRQESRTSDMIFSCGEIVRYVASHMTLYPGDIILTGTPAGVILGYPKEKRVWLRDGDQVTVEIEKLGSLTNRIRRIDTEVEK
jgi:2-keto-4-pentenoate hydratase/2-oxohepta-3-ene-1,7-dioic acid hydratase in catechol pathway